ncbi:MAG: efflux RND transporter permease subunit [Candidatus Eisenbacteria bacterium]
MLLTLPGGRHVPLSEVAEILDTNREQWLWARLNGSPAVKISIRKQPNANTVKVADQIDARLQRAREHAASSRSDVALQTIQNQADFIRGSVSAVRNAALLGALLAMFVVLIFLGPLRKTFVIGPRIPLAGARHLRDDGSVPPHSQHHVRVVLPSGWGSSSTSSIVMLENIFRHKEEGNEAPEEAALERILRGAERGHGIDGHEPGGRGALPAHQRAGRTHLP